ncbi:response regulator [Pelagibacterium halotolerans]|uniref:Two component transcriptional regulator, LuxR family n=1 Tax=Pelagibacterium halotolerans (strain DSM 22347 / JCM 15775 / CGMCC 1.7692 / B2) TaxID=1082931 RepID=G4RB85_PELHB|nr:response regulator transcription factor [Pelagibacterium halotolerans]AEQ51583.1 two component transcriptional regulator, LuxR family [Pelagibacterium halotolerans B2]QJR18587.1 response regulator transcription factor [Pelagibacterium halotolerans]SEA17499.1 two component transcriptional regulator, LuxR family [Pelagibacterium halotolerans]
MTDEKVSIAFVDDHPILLEGMKALFVNKEQFSVVALGTSANDARNIVDTHHPQILFMDLSMPGDVFSVMTEIVRKSDFTKIIVFTAFSSVDSAMRALEAGATGFVLKGATFGELFEAVNSVLRGEMYITRLYASQVLSGLRNRSRQEDDHGVDLSVRERQIVAYLLQARTNREIACSLSISEKTVKRYMTNLMLKLHARNRVEVAMRAQKLAQFKSSARAVALS